MTRILRCINIVDQTNIQQVWQILRDNIIILDLQCVPFQSSNLFRRPPFLQIEQIIFVDLLDGTMPFRSVKHRGSVYSTLGWISSEPIPLLTFLKISFCIHPPKRSQLIPFAYMSNAVLVIQHHYQV